MLGVTQRVKTMVGVCGALESAGVGGSHEPSRAGTVSTSLPGPPAFGYWGKGLVLHSLSLSFFFFIFLGSPPQHMEVPRLGVQSEL